MKIYIFLFFCIIALFSLHGVAQDFQKDGNSLLVYSESYWGNYKKSDIAQGKPTYQTSNAWGGFSFRAVDGDKNGDYANGGVTSTQEESNPTWYIDLIDNYVVREIHIYNRIDYKPKRIEGTVVYVGRTTDEGIDWVSVGELEKSNVTKVKIPIKKGVDVRFVKLVNEGKGKVLSFAEIDILGILRSKINTDNIAYKKQTYGSSEKKGFELSNLNDGNSDCRIEGNSITETESQQNSYVYIDLEGTYDVDRIDIINRGDEKRSMLEGSQIFLETGFDGKTKNILTELSDEVVQSFSTQKMEIAKNVRYVSIRHHSNKPISLAEIKIYGKRHKKEIPNIALGKTTFQSSDYENATSEKAIDGKEQGLLKQGGVAATQKGKNPFWFIDMNGSSKIELIEIYNRRDCCKLELEGGKVFVGKVGVTTKGIDWTEVAVLKGISYNAIELSQLKDAKNVEYIKIQIFGENRLLALTEVAIYGTPNEITNNSWYRNKKRNIALRLTTSQSPSEINTSYKAVDGNIDTYLSGNSISISDRQEDPYWGVDFEQDYDIGRIEIYSKSEGYGESFKGSILYVGKVKNDKYIYKEVAQLDEITLQVFDFSQNANCKDIRTIKIVNKGKNKILFLAEVKVYAR